MATGTQKTEFDTDKFSFTKNSGGDEQTVGAYVVTKKDNLVLVHAFIKTFIKKPYQPNQLNSSQAFIKTFIKKQLSVVTKAFIKKLSGWRTLFF